MSCPCLSQVEAPKAAEPVQAAAPKVEAPKAAAPVVEAPKVRWVRGHIWVLLIFDQQSLWGDLDYRRGRRDTQHYRMVLLPLKRQWLSH